MDPNAALAEIRELATRVAESDFRPFDAEVTELAERVLALDKWLCDGGFFPDEWAHGTIECTNDFNGCSC